MWSKLWQKEDAGCQLTAEAVQWGLVSNFPRYQKSSTASKAKLLELATATGDTNTISQIYLVGHSLEKWTKFPGLKPEDLDIKDSVIFEKANPSNKVPVAELAAMVGSSLNLGFPPGGWPEDLLEKRPVLAARDLPQVAPIMEYAWFKRVSVTNYDYVIARAIVPLTRQVTFCEVAVDTDTGNIDVTKVIRVYDPGKVISPEGCEGQECGGTYMGIGRAVMEEVIYDSSTGVKLNDNLLDYKFTTMNDIGEIGANLVETALGFGPYGSCGIAEAAATVTPSVLAPAIYNAIGKWIYDYPITPDKVLKALGKA
jgi:xanthine dehydrogenase molybdenum-binding subunit